MNERGGVEDLGGCAKIKLCGLVAFGRNPRPVWRDLERPAPKKISAGLKSFPFLEKKWSTISRILEMGVSSVSRISAGTRLRPA